MASEEDFPLPAERKPGANGEGEPERESRSIETKARDSNFCPDLDSLCFCEKPEIPDWEVESKWEIYREVAGKEPISEWDSPKSPIGEEKGMRNPRWAQKQIIDRKLLGKK